MTDTKRGPLFLILFAALMAGAGNGISIVAFPWLVLQRNGSALDASIVAMAGTLPLLAATLIAGAAVDYLGRRRVSMISDALSALSVAAVPWSTGWRLKLSVAGVVDVFAHMLAVFWSETDLPGPGVTSPQTYALFLSRMFPLDPTPPMTLVEFGSVRPSRLTVA